MSKTYRGPTQTLCFEFQKKILALHFAGNSIEKVSSFCECFDELLKPLFHITCINIIFKKTHKSIQFPRQILDIGRSILFV